MNAFTVRSSITRAGIGSNASLPTIPKRGAADLREGSLETQIVRRMSDRPVVPINSTSVGSSPCVLNPAPTFLPPSSASRSAAQR
jgi:hypothetical protein